jgi:hypothetical protein
VIPRSSLLAVVLVAVLAACGSSDCACAPQAAGLSFVGQVRSVERGTCTDGDTDRVLFAVERWEQQAPSVGNPGEIVIQYECSAHFLDVGSEYAVAAAASGDRGWSSSVGVEQCNCVPLTTASNGADVPTGVLASLSATITWWMVALGALAGVAITLGRRWVWRWRHLTNDGLRAAVLSALTMVGGAVAATGGIALLARDRSRVGVEWAMWAAVGIGAAVMIVAMFQRPKPASSD